MKDSFYIGLIYVLIIAIVMTIFELAFFTLILVPQETERIRQRLEDSRDQFHDILYNGVTAGVPAVTDSNKGLITAYFNSFYNWIIDYLKVGTIREGNLNDTINTNAIIFIIVEITLFMLLIMFCYFKIKSGSVGPIIFLGILTGVILIGFQGIMYNFADGFGNLGDQAFQFASDNEIKMMVFEKLKQDLM